MKQYATIEADSTGRYWAGGLEGVVEMQDYPLRRALNSLARMGFVVLYVDSKRVVLERDQP